MKTLTFCFLCILLCIYTGRTQIPEISWEKELTLSLPHYFSDVQELAGGNFIVLGAVEQPGENHFDIWLLEISGQGDTLKTSVFENAGEDIPMRLLLNGEDGYLLAYLNKSGGQGYTSRLLAVGKDFGIRWTLEAEQPAIVFRSDITADNAGYFWWMNTIPEPEGKSKILLSKLDGKGNRISNVEIGGKDVIEGYALRALPDGTVGVSCTVMTDRKKPLVQVLRLDQEGKMIWKATIPDAVKNLTPQCLCCSPDNTLLLGGWAGLCYNPDESAENQIWDFDYLLTKLDADGKILWTQNYNREGSEKGTAVAVLPDGKIMAAGKCETSFTGSVGPWLLLVDSNGKKVDDRVYKFKFVKDQISRIICTNDGGLLMIGPGYIDSQHQLTGWIRKLNVIL